MPGSCVSRLAAVDCARAREAMMTVRKMLIMMAKKRVAISSCSLEWRFYEVESNHVFMPSVGEKARPIGIRSSKCMGYPIS